MMMITESGLIITAPNYHQSDVTLMVSSEIISGY